MALGDEKTSRSQVPPPPPPPPLPSKPKSTTTNHKDTSTPLMNSHVEDIPAKDSKQLIPNGYIVDKASGGSVTNTSTTQTVDPQHPPLGLPNGTPAFATSKPTPDSLQDSPSSDPVSQPAAENSTESSSPKTKNSKQSRLQRAFSAHSLTLPSLRKSSKSRKTEARNSVTGVPIETTDEKTDSLEKEGPKSNLREAPLWRLPGMATLKKRKNSSTSSDSGPNAKPVIPPKPATIRLESLPQVTSPPSDRDLPALPSLAAIKRELPPIPTEEPSTHAFGHTTDSTTNLGHLDASIGTNSTGTSRESLVERTNDGTTEKTNGKVSPAPSASSLSLPSKPSDSAATATLSVSDMLKQYSQMFPLRFRVLQGYCSETTDVNISTGEVHDLHSVKKTNVVTIKDEDGTTYHIPLEAPMMFGLIFNLSSNYDEGLTGYTFKAISDITSLSTLPKVICATNAVESSDERMRVEENEVFVVCQVQRSMFKGKKGLKVFSLLSKSAKVLPEDCAGGFSTNPSLVRMHLPDILDYVTKPFPSRAVMYPMSDNSALCQDIPGTQSGVISLVEHSAESALVVSTVVDPEQEMVMSSDGTNTFDIPLNDDISDLEVMVLKHTEPLSDQVADDDVIVPPTNLQNDEEIDDHVYDDTISVLEKSQASIALQLTSSMSRSMPETLNIEMQAAALTSSPAIRERNGPHYVNLPQQPPPPWYEQEDSEEVNAEYDEEDGYDTVGLHLLQKPTDREAGSTSPYQQVSSERKNSDPHLTSWMEDVQGTTRVLERRFNSMESSQQASEMNRMQAMLEQLTQKLESVDSQLHNITTSPPPPPLPSRHMATTNESTTTSTTAVDENTPGLSSTEDGGATAEEANKTYLKSLNIEKVCDLLDAMDLGQYKDKVRKEQISGEILIECDESVLQEELGIASKIHRIRLMKIISGQHSAENILHKQ